MPHINTNPNLLLIFTWQAEPIFMPLCTSAPSKLGWRACYHLFCDWSNQLNSMASILGKGCLTTCFFSLHISATNKLMLSYLWIRMPCCLLATAS